MKVGMMQITAGTLGVIVKLLKGTMLAGELRKHSVTWISEKNIIKTDVK